jgi:hypothetical protein
VTTLLDGECQIILMLMMVLAISNIAAVMLANRPPLPGRRAGVIWNKDLRYL